eukprot:242102-Chlamydomonas_euryale.AAC.2
MAAWARICVGAHACAGLCEHGRMHAWTPSYRCPQTCLCACLHERTRMHGQARLHVWAHALILVLLRSTAFSSMHIRPRACHAHFSTSWAPTPARTTSPPPRRQPRALSNTIWAIATFHQLAHGAGGAGAAAAELSPPRAWVSEFLSAFARRLPSCSDQAASNVMWALAVLQLTPDEALASSVLLHLWDVDSSTGALRDGGGAGDGGRGRGRGGDAAAAAAGGTDIGVSTQALSNCLWALAKLGFSLTGPAADVVAKMLRRRLPAAAAAPQLQRNFHPSELASVWYSYAKLRTMPPPDVLSALTAATHAEFAAAAAQADAAAAAAPRGGGDERSEHGPARAAARLAPQDLSNIVWAVATLGVRPNSAWLSAFWAAASRQLPVFGTKDLAQTVYALARLGWLPGPAGLAQQMPPRTQGGRQAADAMAAVEAGCAMVGPGIGGVGLEGGIGGEDGGDGMDVDGSMDVDDGMLRSMVRGAGSEAVLAASSATGDASAATVDSEGAAPAGDSAGAASAGGGGNSGGVAMLLAAAERALPSCSSQDMANLAWGLAALRVRPGTAWCARLALELVRRADGMSCAHAATSLWALGKLGFRPAARQLRGVERTLFQRLAQMRPRELSACAWAFAAMDYEPDEQWLEAFSDQ